MSIRAYIIPTFCGALLALSIVACGGDDEDPGSGDQITVQYTEFESFDPHFTSYAPDIGHQRMVWRGLYRYDSKNVIQPELAAALPEVSADALTYTVRLKDGLTWSDGKDLTTADFVLGVQRTCNPDVAGEYSLLLFVIEGCEAYYSAADASRADKEALRAQVGVRAVDASTIAFKLTTPQPTFLAVLTLWMTLPVPSHVLGDPGAAWPEPTALVFNGPFVVESYTAGDRMVFARNERYGGGDQAQLERVTFRYVADGAQANNAFRTGELDVADGDPANIAGLRAEFGDRLVSVPLAATRALYLRMDNEALAKDDVRLALSKATDRERLVTTVLQGSGVPSTTWVPAEIAGGEADFSATVGFDPAGAREALARAGYPGGNGFPTLEYLIVDVPVLRAVGEFLQSQWKDILGVRVEIVALDSQSRSQRYDEGAFDVFPAGFAQDYSDPENWLSVVVEDGPFNRQGCSDPELEALLAKARVNTNNAERLAQYREINEMLSTRLCGLLVLYHDERHTLVGDVEGPREFASAQDMVLAGDSAIEEWRRTR